MADLGNASALRSNWPIGSDERTCSLTKATLAEPEARPLLPACAPLCTGLPVTLLADEPATLLACFAVDGAGEAVSAKLKLDMLAGSPPAPFVADNAGEDFTEDVSEGRKEVSVGPS